MSKNSLNTNQREKGLTQDLLKSVEKNEQD